MAVEKRGRNGWFSTETGQFYKSEKAAKDAESSYLQSDKTKTIDSLKNQLLTQWKQLGVPSIGGGLSIEARAKSLADRLYANNITDISKLRLGSKEIEEVVSDEGGTTKVKTPKQFLQYDGRQIGFLGNADDGGRNADPKGYLQSGGLASWTAAGKGAVGYTAKAAPNGQVYFIPSWGSTSDLSTVAPLVGLGLMFVPGLQGVGASIGTALGASGTAAAALGNAIIQGTLAEATGGDFLKGAAAGAIGSYVPGVQSEIAGALGGGAAANVAAGALTGGAMSELTGGDFAKGALIGGIGSGINQSKLSAAEDYLQSLPTGGYDTTTAPTEVDVLEIIAAESPDFRISDTSFTPDYSLSTGAPVIPEMGAQGIQVPTINQVIDVLDEVDYSLPAPSSGLGLVMPTAPNLDSMGGGQGITVPVSGGTLTEAGVIPVNYVPVLGDEQSFINQPAPNVEIVIPEQPASQPNQPTEPKDISSNLAILDVVKALVPTLVTAAITEQVNNKQEEPAQTGFPILPVPSDWRSPQYNMAFTPSAPIDFGSPAMLQGTQWANPINLSSVIKMLNQPIIAPETQQMMTQFQAPTMPYETGVNDIIGNIGGQPVSIADIIAGIQSGQNYSS